MKAGVCLFPGDSMAGEVLGGQVDKMGLKNLLNILILQFLSGILRMKLALLMCQPTFLGNTSCTL